MDWSEILTQSEAEYMMRVLDELKVVAWAAPLLREIGARGGITYENKPLLFERFAKVASIVDWSGMPFSFGVALFGASDTVPALYERNHSVETFAFVADAHLAVL